MLFLKIYAHVVVMKTLKRLAVSSKSENEYLIYLETSICKKCTHIQRTKILSQIGC